jgi:hypothetical protein
MPKASHIAFSGQLRQFWQKTCSVRPLRGRPQAYTLVQLRCDAFGVSPSRVSELRPVADQCLSQLRTTPDPERVPRLLNSKKMNSDAEGIAHCLQWTA